MSLLALAFIAAAALVLVALGVVVGAVFGTDDDQIDLLARRLVAEQRMEAVTQATVRAMREAARRHG